jgi:membrane fusion protein (multidrug efflux system)
VELILADGSAYPQKGQITFVDPVINAQTGTYNIRAVVPNPDNPEPRPVRAGATQGRGSPQRDHGAASGGDAGANGKFVFVVGPDNTAQPKPIQVGDWYGDQWIVNSGLQAGDRVVVDGAVRLQPGAPVQIRPPRARARPAKVPSATPLKP